MHARTAPRFRGPAGCFEVSAAGTAERPPRGPPREGTQARPRECAVWQRLVHPCPVSLEPGPTCPTRDPAWSVVQLFSRKNLASHFISPPTSSLAGSLRALSQHEGAPVPLPWQAFCPHDRSIVLCLLRAVQLNIANPSTGKQKLIEIEDEKKLCAAAQPRLAAVLAPVLAARTQSRRSVWLARLS
jgi:hypothetical protein